MKKTITKYNKSINFIALIGYLILFYFSAFHYHTVVIPVNKNYCSQSFLVNTGNNYEQISHENCEKCYLLNSTNPIFQSSSTYNSFIQSFTIISEYKLNKIVSCVKTVKRLRAPPVKLS